jgi:hypothetical protein
VEGVRTTTGKEKSNKQTIIRERIEGDLKGLEISTYEVLPVIPFFQFPEVTR